MIDTSMRLSSSNPSFSQDLARIDYYKHNVMFYQPINPCMVKWKLLGFWTGDEVGEDTRKWSSKSIIGIIK